MKVIFHEDFYQAYTSDPAAVKARMEAVVDGSVWVEQAEVR